ncbi:MAG: tRNA (N(6)-L-threonylcarbamoyladenosine(37)-C(2))-methylthiotransferase MtaB, partial [Candidatus Cloacimonetes bacterium]|nr:tRNA (N(6)-L-threonylcarbamoyladenosine(37)-C(2))-methylthiotransferase MtaB [Candidatus Cloacimonadota bacterium]
LKEHGTGRKLGIVTLGCRLNQFESEAVAGQFRSLGWQDAGADEECDLVVIDTCSVTDRADQKARQAIRSAIRRNPEAVIAVTGCYTQTAADEIAAIPGVDYVLGNREKLDLPACMPELAKQDSPVIRVSRPGRAGDREFLSVSGFERHTRATLKIQDGCDVFCTYCIVPFTRGRSRSLRQDEILDQARLLVEEQGFRELVLTGVHIGDWGREQGASLAGLVQQLIRIPGLARVRLSSIEPWDISQALIELMAGSEQFCSHLHAPIQSGSAEVLRAMGRRIDAVGLWRLLERMVEAIPDLGLGTDVIVGFPGEGEAQYQETLRMLSELPFSRLHVFPYSERRGTRAVHFAGAVAPSERKRRCRELIALGEQKMQAFNDRHVGQTARVLVESRVISGFSYGYTDNYIRVELPACPERTGEILAVRLEAGDDAVMRGQLTASESESA